MIGLQGFAYQKNNLLLQAAIAATVAASGKLPLIYPVTKKGTGNIAITGAYTGADDAQYDIKIVDTALDTPVVSAPTFRGAGTGKIRDIAVIGLAEQKISLTCMSTGITTQQAVVDIEGLLYRAKPAGAAGNAISMSIDDSTLVFTATDYSTIRPLKVGDTGIEGTEWDFDTKVLLGDLVPATAHRIAFGADRLHVYRQYKKFEEGKYRYYFILPLRYEVPTGSRVYFVTGGRTITVTDGVTTEIYADIITAADFWTAVREASALIEPLDSAIDTSMSPTSPAVRESALKTEAYFLPAYRDDKSSVYAGELTNVVTKPGTKTELIEVKCINNDFVGAELWELKGSSSGALGQCRTGEINDFGPIVCEIPQKLPTDFGAPKEDWSHAVAYASRGTGVAPPPICFAMRLGINAAAQTLTLEYKKKPTACSCPTMTFGDACLGFEPKGGEIGMAYTVPDLIFWTDALRERMNEASFYSEQFERDYDFATVRSFDVASKRYFDLLKILAARIMALPEDVPATLTAMIVDYKALANNITIKSAGSAYIPTWQSNSPAAVNEIKQPITPNSFHYRAILAGDTGTVEPTWPLIVGQTVVDGTVTWECIPITTEITWNAATSAWTGYFLITPLSIDVLYSTSGYAALVDAVLEYERTYGLKKNSIIAPGTCWSDSESEYYWEVRGNKAYLPAFTDISYYSTIKQGDTYVNTKEFAFNISVPCGGSLLEGDKITVSIGGIQISRTYLVGDTTYLPTIAAQPLSLSGGIDGDDSYTWEVRGSVAGLFAAYILDRTAPAPYSNGGLSLVIDDGIIKFQVGDLFKFSVEGGHFKWRKDGGAWSAALDILPVDQDLYAGLQIAFIFGVAPSFVTDDQWEILCMQENRAANMADIGDGQYKGTGNIVFSFAAAVEIDTLIIDNYDITGDFSFQASDAADFSLPLIHNELIAAAGRLPLICKLYLDAPITAKYFRLVPAVGSTIGYCFLGNLMRLSRDTDKIKPVKKYVIDRKAGKRSFGLTNYVITGYTLIYDTFLSHANFALLDALVEWSKGNNDEPFYLIPNTRYPDTIIKGLIEADDIEMDSVKDENMSVNERQYTISLPIVGTQ